MKKVFIWLILLSTPYVSFFEWRVDFFFKHIKSTSNPVKVKEKLLKLMQRDLITVNIWMEKKFKGYLYLTKKVRRQMYKDAVQIRAKLEENIKANEVQVNEVAVRLKNLDLPFIDSQAEKLRYLFSIMQFLTPGGNYEYVKTSSFGKLIRDPHKEKLEGDCNQIVTLYMYLYSLKFPIADLKIKLLPEHVCLHFNGIDIEATNGQFAKYSEYEELLPATEIISTNLLDLSDFREDTQQISERVILKSAQLAYAISSLKNLVAKNLETAYRNLGIVALNSKNYDSAVFYLEQIADKTLLKQAYHNGAIYFMDAKNFEKAKILVDKSGESDLKRTIRYNEGVHLYDTDQIDKALYVFSELGDEKMKKACYGKKYNELAKKVASVKTTLDAKKYKSTYQEMLSLAQKMGDSDLQSNLQNTLKQI